LSSDSFYIPYNRKNGEPLQETFEQEHCEHSKGGQDDANGVGAEADSLPWKGGKPPKDHEADDATGKKPAEGAIAFKPREQPRPKTKEEHRTPDRNLVSHACTTNGKKTGNYKQ
jgi:hypothetical protein